MLVKLLYRLLLQRLSRKRPGQNPQIDHPFDARIQRRVFPRLTNTHWSKIWNKIWNKTWWSMGFFVIAFGTIFALVLTFFHPVSIEESESATGKLVLNINESEHWPVVVFLDGNNLPTPQSIPRNPHLSGHQTPSQSKIRTNIQPTIRSDEYVNEITSINSSFFPDFQILASGSQLKITNSDPVAHNTHVFNGIGTSFNVALPLADQVVTKTLSGTGMFSVRCDLHPSMQAWLFAPPSDHYAVVHVPDSVIFSELKSGEYRLHLWHARRPEAIRVVSLDSGEQKVLSLK